MKTSDVRIEDALNLAGAYGGLDGAHHKMWVIDQMVRALLESEEEYEEWVKDYQGDLVEDDGEEEYEYIWDTGIAP